MTALILSRGQSFRRLRLSQRDAAVFRLRRLRPPTLALARVHRVELAPSTDISTGRAAALSLRDGFTEESLAGRRASLSAVGSTTFLLLLRSLDVHSRPEAGMPLDPHKGRERTSNDPSAGSPTETLLRLLLPLNDQVWTSFRQLEAPRRARRRRVAALRALRHPRAPVRRPH